MSNLNAFLATIAIGWILAVYDVNDTLIFAGGEYRSYEECRQAGIARVPRGGKFLCARR